MKSLGVIDPYMISPAVNCYNHLNESLPIKTFYHLPGQINLDTLDSREHDGYIVLGSASHIHQNLGWHPRLAQFIASKLKQGIPVLGCCFGHQLMAWHYGSEVTFFHADEQKILQTRVSQFQTDFLDFKKGDQFEWGVTHRQIVKKLGPELVSIAGSDQFPNDVIIHKSLPFLGLQAHPEASQYFLEKECCIPDFSVRQKVQKNGMQIIQSFFKFHGLWS